jgi:hypothetical protein
MVETTFDGSPFVSTNPLKTIVGDTGQQEFNATTESINPKQVVNPNSAVTNTPPPGMRSDKFLSKQRQIELLSEYKSK